MRKQGEQVDPCGHLPCDFVVYILGAITVIIRMIQYRMALIYNNLNITHILRSLMFNIKLKEIRNTVL